MAVRNTDEGLMEECQENGGDSVDDGKTQEMIAIFSQKTLAWLQCWLYDDSSLKLHFPNTAQNGSSVTPGCRRKGLVWEVCQVSPVTVNTNVHSTMSDVAATNARWQTKAVKDWW
ncbi:predicted protein [Histoplasma capsulatum var. duboisii H88]|uniref:Predicted protein n=1 Tax=Ajellomyces capsulatus (strain H88) TaxID=544711 RepID=F0U880_AJEC8|nr:predicted protein [Histoplasma capsulatum var. duboisii H88]